MLKKQYLKTKSICKVTFVLPESIKAEEAYVVGDFNAWSETTPMKKHKDGHFVVTVNLPKGCEYQFRYLVNGKEWHNDWHADNYASNPFNGDNSVVVT